MKDVDLYHDDNEFVLIDKYNKLKTQLKEANTSIQSLKHQLADAGDIFNDALEYIKVNDNPDKEIAELIFWYRNKYNKDKG